jgi:hypothetical protein
MSATSHVKFTDRRDGYATVEINGTPRGWVERTDGGLWQARVFTRAIPGQRNVKVGLPYTTRREAGDEIAIQWEGWN